MSVTLITLILTSITTSIGACAYQMHPFDIFICALGVISLAYIAYCISFIIAEKIQRDIMLIKKNYWLWILLLVVAVPFVFARLILLLDIPNMELLSETNRYAIIPAEGDAEAKAVLWSVFFHYIDSGNQHITAMSGRVVSGILTVCGIFLFNGLLVSTLLSWTERRRAQWKNGDIRYSIADLPKNRFALVIGANEIVVSVVKELLHRPSRHSGTSQNNYVVLQTSSNVSQVRELLLAHLTDEEVNRVICYNAHRDSAKEIAHLHVAYASEILVLGESTLGRDAETAHDALNMRCVNLIAHELNAYKTKFSNIYKKKTCRVMFDYHTTYSVFQYSDIANEVRETLTFIPFNMYESWARKVIVSNHAESNGSIVHYTPLDGIEGMRETDNQRVHLVIIGMTKMGISLAEQALYHAHYLNFDKYRSRITFIDTQADVQMGFFKGRHATLFELMRHKYVEAASTSETEGWIDPMSIANKWQHLSKERKSFIDIEMEFIKGAVESDAVRNYLIEIAGDPHSKLTIAVCLNHTHQALAASLYMPIEVYESKQLQEVWVYQREAMDMVANLTDESVATGSIRYKKLRPFGMLNSTELWDDNLIKTAMLVNAAYDVINHRHEWPATMGDMHSEAYKHIYDSWNNLMVHKKWSNCFFADSIRQKIRSICNGDARLSLEEALQSHKETLGISEHNRWNMEQLLMGYAPCNHDDDDKLRELVETGNQIAQYEFKNNLKMSAAKVHPNICDYDHLSSIDPVAKEYDIQLIYAIPQIITLAGSM